MKRSISTACILSLLACCGCKPEGAISPQERVVTKPEKQDFGLVDTWQSIPDPKFDENGKTDVLTIEIGDDGVYKVESTALDKISVSLRATALDDDSGCAIVDVEAQLQDKVLIRLLALAKRKDDNLYVWWIESKNLAQLMCSDGHSAVIEHGSFGTKVHAKPDQLVACVRKHSRELVRKPILFRSIAR